MQPPCYQRAGEEASSLGQLVPLRTATRSPSPLVESQQDSHIILMSFGASPPPTGERATYGAMRRSNLWLPKARADPSGGLAKKPELAATSGSFNPMLLFPMDVQMSHLLTGPKSTQTCLGTLARQDGQAIQCYRVGSVIQELPEIYRGGLGSSGHSSPLWGVGIQPLGLCEGGQVCCLCAKTEHGDPEHL